MSWQLQPFQLVAKLRILVEFYAVAIVVCLNQLRLLRDIWLVHYFLGDEIHDAVELQTDFV